MMFLVNFPEEIRRVRWFQLWWRVWLDYPVRIRPALSRTSFRSPSTVERLRRCASSAYTTHTITCKSVRGVSVSGIDSISRHQSVRLVPIHSRFKHTVTPCRCYRPRYGQQCPGVLQIYSGLKLVVRQSCDRCAGEGSLHRRERPIVTVRQNAVGCPPDLRVCFGQGLSASIIITTTIRVRVL